MSLNESFKHIRNLQNMNDSFALSSARSIGQDHDNEIMNLVKQLKDKNEDNKKLSDEIKK